MSFLKNRILKIIKYRPNAWCHIRPSWVWRSSGSSWCRRSAESTNSSRTVPSLLGLLIISGKKLNRNYFLRKSRKKNIFVFDCLKNKNNLDSLLAGPIQVPGIVGFSVCLWIRRCRLEQSLYQFVVIHCPRIYDHQQQKQQHFLRKESSKF